MNHKCPYCGSSKMTVDVDVRVTADLLEDGTIRCRDIWTPDVLTEEQIASSSSEDIHGFCNDCGLNCDFDWEQGFVIKQGNKPVHNV